MSPDPERVLLALVVAQCCLFCGQPKNGQGEGETTAQLINQQCKCPG